MSTRFFKNVSGTLYSFPEINRVKPVGADPNKEIKFTQKEIDTSELLQDLIKKGRFVEVQGKEKIDVPEERNYPQANTDSGKNNDNEIRTINPRERTGGDAGHSYESFEADNSVSRSESRMVRRRGEEGGGISGIGKESTSEYRHGRRDSQEKISSTKEGSVDEKKIEKKIEMWIKTPFSDMGGYGKMARYSLESLYDKGVNIQAVKFTMPDIRNAITDSPKMQQMTRNKVSIDAPSVWAMMPPKFPDRRGKKIYFTMIESNDVAPTFLEKTERSDELWLPSKHNIEIFSAKNTKCELVHVPLGVDAKLYRPMDSDEIQGKMEMQTKGFVFTSVFGWSVRKGVDVLFKTYLSTFTSEDDVSLVVVSRLNGSSSQENINKIRSQIRNYIKQYCKDPDKHPHIIHIGTGIPEEDLPVLYNKSDCFVLPSRGEGFGLPYLEAGVCFPEGTKIWDGQKLINIEHCYVGQKILNHKGKEDKIVNKSVRKYSGNMISIDVGGYFDKLVSTDNHPISKYSNEEIKWEEAKNIKEGDEIAYPIQKPDVQDYYSNGILIDSNLAYVLGLYAAEGNIIVNSQVTFTFSKKEIEYAESVKSICDSIFGECSIIEDYDLEKSYIRVYVKNSKFARICHDLLDRGSYYKKIDYKIKNSSEKVLKSFVKGYFDGDANYGNRSLDVSSASKNLLLGIRDILLSLGIITSLTFRCQNNKNSHYALYCGGEDKRKLYKILDIEFEPPKGKGGKSWMRIKKVDGVDFLLYKVKAVDLEYVENIDVYNFTIENEHTYIVEGFAVHNCGIPVIATRCGGQLDFLNDENSYLCEIEGFGMEKQEMREISSYYEGMPFAVLGNKCYESLRDHMRYVYNNPEKGKAKAQILRKHILDNFTWEHTANKMYERLV